MRAQTAEAIPAPKVISESDLARYEQMSAALVAGIALGVF
jgi:hypothetical protein